MHPIRLLLASFSLLGCLFLASPARAQSSCAADITGDGVVDGADLGALLTDWGRCKACSTDLNGDGVVGGDDLAAVLNLWGGTCAPTIASVTPASGPTAGGTAITITGTHLAGVTAVTIGGIAATGVVAVDATTVTALTPASGGGPKAIEVQSPGGTATRANGFTYLTGGEVVVAIDYVNPTSGPIAGGTAFMISGSGLSTTTGVSIGGVPATNVMVMSDFVIRAFTGPGTELGAQKVSVTTAYGVTESETPLFTYLPPPLPTVSSVYPREGVTFGGTAITILGTNLQGTTAVTIGGVPATGVAVLSPSMVTAVAPAGSQGGQPILVFAGATSVSGPLFTYLPYLTPGWAMVLEPNPDETVVTSPLLRERIRATGFPWRVRDIVTNMEMVLIPPGTYEMGCTPSDVTACLDIPGFPGYDESPVHTVTLTKPFYMGRREVTQAQWTAVMGSNPSHFTSASAQVPASEVPNRPVESVSWVMIAGPDGFMETTGMRLPTEAEWEFAYRAGTTTAFHGWPSNTAGTNDESEVGSIAWCGGNSSLQTHPVGQLAPNGFGLYDMSGNVAERVNDWYGVYPSSAQTDPTGPATGSPYNLIPTRGGAYSLPPGSARSSARLSQGPSIVDQAIGFRAVRNARATTIYAVNGVQTGRGQPAYVQVGDTISIAGSGMTGATSVSIGGLAVGFTVLNDGVVQTVAPAHTGAGPINVVVTTPLGTAGAVGALSYYLTPSWATVLEVAPDPVAVTSAALRAQILATGRPWRVLDNDTQVEMNLIPPGTFQMGCSASDQDNCSEVEYSVHTVTLTNAFYLGRYEVTTFATGWVEGEAGGSAQFPVQMVNWNDCRFFCEAAGGGVRLPTEAEWEYACRAGTTTAYHGWPLQPSGTNLQSEVASIGWTLENSSGTIQAVGQLAPNGFGLYDMAGNVMEWVHDCSPLIAQGYPSTPQTNPTGSSQCDQHVLRGGNYDWHAGNARSSQRNFDQPDTRFDWYGFRVARNP